MPDPRAPYRRIAVGTDHGGFELKNRVISFLEEEGLTVMDCGTYDSEAADYPIYASRVARAISTGLVDAGILLCKSGNGVAMVANRYPGVRAGWAEDAKAASTTREHNNANALVIGSEHLNGDLIETVRAWLNTRHEPASRHGRRVAMIDELDQVHVSALPALRMIQAGSSPWLASVQPSLADSDDFKGFISRHHLRGATVGRGPLAKEIASDPERWRAAILQWDRERLDKSAVAESLYTGYVRMVADALSTAYQRSGGDDGLVAVRVAVKPEDSPGSIVERARALLGILDRPNAFLSLPSFAPMGTAIIRLAEDGHSLLLRGVVSPDRVDSIIESWFAALQQRLADNLPVHAQRLILSVPVSSILESGHGKNLGVIASHLLNAVKRWSQSSRFRELAFVGATLPRLAWDCEGVDSRAGDLARQLFAPLTIQIHDTAFFDLPEGALDGAVHPLIDWLKASDSPLGDYASGTSPNLDALQESVPLDLCRRENEAGEALIEAISAALKR